MGKKVSCFLIYLLYLCTLKKCSNLPESVVYNQNDNN